MLAKTINCWLSLRCSARIKSGHILWEKDLDVSKSQFLVKSNKNGKCMMLILDTIKIVPSRNICKRIHIWEIFMEYIHSTTSLDESVYS